MASALDRKAPQQATTMTERMIAILSAANSETVQEMGEERGRSEARTPLCVNANSSSTC
jgi:hypothetical protein